jgi:hypothetical protein
LLSRRSQPVQPLFTPSSAPLPQQLRFLDETPVVPFARSKPKLRLAINTRDPLRSSKSVEAEDILRSAAESQLMTPSTTNFPEKAKSSPGHGYSELLSNAQFESAPLLGTESIVHGSQCFASVPDCFPEWPRDGVDYNLNPEEIDRVLTPDEDPFAKAEVVPISFVDSTVAAHAIWNTDAPRSGDTSALRLPAQDGAAYLLAPPTAISPKSSLTSLGCLRGLSTPMSSVISLQPPTLKNREKGLPPIPQEISETNVARESQHSRVSRFGRTLFVPPTPPRQSSVPLLSVSGFPVSRVADSKVKSDRRWFLPILSPKEPHHDGRPSLRDRLGSAFKFSLRRQSRSPAPSTDSSFTSRDVHTAEWGKSTRPLLSQGSPSMPKASQRTRITQDPIFEAPQFQHRREKSVYGAQISPLSEERTPVPSLRLRQVSYDSLLDATPLASTLQNRHSPPPTSSPHAQRKGSFPFQTARARGLGELDLMFTARAMTPSSHSGTSEADARSMGSTWNSALSSSQDFDEDMSAVSALGALGLDVGERPLFTNPWLEEADLCDEAESCTIASSEGTEESIEMHSWPMPPVQSGEGWVGIGQQGWTRGKKAKEVCHSTS